MAVRAGNKQVTVIDLGAGENGFARQLLSDPTVAGQSRQILKSHPDIHIDFHALTDAKKQEDFLKRTQIPSAGTVSGPDNTQITAESIFYSVTSTQSLAKFFKDTKIDKINLGVSVGFLTYLHPEVFEQVMVDLTDRLDASGRLVLHRYATISGSSLSRDDKVKDREVIFETGDFSGPVNTGEIRQAANQLLADESVDEREIVAMLRWINRVIMVANVFPYREPLHLFAQIQGKEPREMLEFTVNDTLTRAESLVDLPEVKRQKKAILKSLQNQFKGKAELEYNDEGILISKPGRTHSS